MADVFLSYKREDAARVRKLVAALRGAGLDVWWDEDIPASAPWEATIERALAEAKAVLVCWSPDSVASENVRSEARVAREDGRLIQLFLKPCSPPLFFGERQGVDLSTWRGKADDPRIARLAETARKVAAGERAEGGDRPKLQRRIDLRIAAAASVLLLLVGSAAGWWFLSPAKASGPMTIAVLPFRALDPADNNLVDAIWDDTRGAISRNPNLRVLGRTAVETLAARHLDPADYRRKVGADYLLDGGVQRQGDKVQINVSLVRTADGSEVWNDRIGGKLDDVFAFQQRIAREVEGRIRGRIAPGGGVRAQNIATSSQAYALYAEARGLILKRGNGHGAMGQARDLLKKVLAIDPNYAPAWADLGEATGMGGGPDQTREAIGDLQRALQLAPNLAHAHAALAMVQGTPPELENELRKAVRIDPNDAEAWMWLGNCLQYQNRIGDARAAFTRAVEIDPLLYPAIGNKIGSLAATNDSAALAAELDRAAKIGDPVFLQKVRVAVAGATGRPGDAAQILLRLRSSNADQTGWVDNHLIGPLLQLGFIEEFAALLGATPDVPAAYRGDPGPPNLVKWGYDNRAIAFWHDNDAPALFGRLLAKKGRLPEYRNLYVAAFQSPDELPAAFANPQRFTMVAPTIAVDLRAAGDPASAQAILARADSLLSGWLRAGPETQDLSMQMAHLRAAEGSDDQAMVFLRRAIVGGWLPDRAFYAVDIADEPCLARLVSRPEFQALRQRVLARIAEERRKVTPRMLADAGLASKMAA